MDMIIENGMISISYYSNNEDTQIILSYIYDNLKDIEGECISSVKRMENNDFEKENKMIFLYIELYLLMVFIK